MKLDRWGNDLYDRSLRNGTNRNWDKIEGSYGAIQENSAEATKKSMEATKNAMEAKEKADNVQNQLNSIVVNGDSGPEAKQARVDVNGVEHDTLKGRNDSDYNYFNQKNTNLQKESDAFAVTMQKARKNKSFTICFMGDSTIYGSDFNSSDKRAPDPIPADDGTAHVATRASKTVTESLSEHLNKVYDTVTVINRGYSGDSAELGYKHWPGASGADVCLISYGINDATNPNIPYAGDVQKYLYWYRKVIERELKNGTSVIIMTPIKQRVVSSSDIDSRTEVDVFAAAVMKMASEYNIPVIEGNVVLEGYSSSIYSDGTHLNGTGYNILGARLASLFIGKGAHNRRKVFNGTVLGTRSQLDNFKVVGGTIQGYTNYPTPDEMDIGKGVGVGLSNGSKIVYSIYCEHPNMVVVPTFYSGEGEILVSVDFGVEQAQYPLSYSYYEKIFVDYTKKQPGKIRIGLNDLTSGVYSSFMVKYRKQPVLMVTSRGWHTITVEAIAGKVTFHALEFFDYETYKNKVVNMIDVTLLNGASAFDAPRTPKIIIERNGFVSLQGTLNTFSPTPSIPFGKIDSAYAPIANQTFPVALSPSANGGFGTVTITPSGQLFFNFASVTGAEYTNLNGVRWKMNE
ncbi:SGNH/GDSL hydrolase family protein [Bacillus cereus]|nr:SGNH/GDSL hydrolase family protein [Bacillus cereus]MCU5315736.1 SGNH/GDSL hydrolase family protein [Bacillus cereus]MCU5480985.1 SGNH/GDSL hydrolase family protein [Bacillus cereus]